MGDNIKYSSECNRDIYMYEFISQVLREYFEQVDHGNLCAIEDVVDNALSTKVVCDTANVREYIESCCRNINRFRKLCEAFVHGYEKCNGRHISNPYPFYIIFQLLGIYNSKNENTKRREAYRLSFLRFIFAKITSEVSIQLQEFIEFICDISKYEEYVAPLLLTIYEPKFIHANVIASLQEISCSMKEEILLILSGKATNNVKEIKKYNTHENHIIEKNINLEHNHSKNDESKECIDKQKGQYSHQELNVKVNFHNHVSEGKVSSSSWKDIYWTPSDAHTVQKHIEATSIALLDTAADNSDTMQRENGNKCKCNHSVVLPPAEVREMALTLPSIQKKTKKMVCNGVFLPQVQEKCCEHVNEHAECSSICKVSNKNSDAIQKLINTTKNDRKNINNIGIDHKRKNVNAFYKGTGTTVEENDNNKMFIESEKSEIEEQKSKGNASPIMKLAPKCNKKDETIEIPHTKATLLKLYALIEEEKRVNEKKLYEKQYRITNKDQTCKGKRSDQVNINSLLDDCEWEEWEKEEKEEEWQQKEYEYEEDSAAVAELARQKAEREIELYKRHLEELEAAERRAEAQRIAQQQKREEFSKAKEEWKKQIAKLSEEHQSDLAAQRSFVTKLRSQIKEQVKQAEANVELHNYTIAQEVKSETERLLAIANTEKEREAKKRMTMIEEIKELRKRLREQRKMNAKIKNKRYGNKKYDRSIHSHLRNNYHDNNRNSKNKKLKHCYSESEEDSDNYCISDDDDESTSERSSSSSSSSKFQEYNMSELELELNRVRDENKRLLQERKKTINAQRNTNHEMRKILSNTCNNELERRRQLRLERQEMAKARVQRTMEWKKSMLQTRLVAMHNKLLKRQESKRQEYEQSKVDAKYNHKLYKNYECKKNELEQRRWAEYENSKINNYKAHLSTEMAQTEEYYEQIKEQQQEQ